MRILPILFGALLPFPALALEASDGPLRDAFRECIASEVSTIEEIVPSVLEASSILLNYLCIREATLYATNKVKSFNETKLGSIEFYTQIENVTQFLMRDAVDYVLTSRKIRLGKF